MSILEEIFKPKGILAQNMKVYDFRQEQLDMAEEVLDALMDKEHLVTEAGTGVGKSFGYLIPAILSFDRTADPIVISTNTINLQEQLVNKDLPWIKKHLNVSFNYFVG